MKHINIHKIYHRKYLYLFMHQQLIRILRFLEFSLSHAELSCTSLPVLSHAELSCTSLPILSHAELWCTCLPVLSHAELSCTSLPVLSHAEQSCTSLQVLSQAELQVIFNTTLENVEIVHESSNKKDKMENKQEAGSRENTFQVMTAKCITKVLANISSQRTI